MPYINRQQRLEATKRWHKNNRSKGQLAERKYEKTRPRHRHKRTLAKYGLTTETYQALLDTQHGVCKICHERPENQRLSVDHDHKTGRVRGLLCSACNFGIGNLKDDPVRIQSALDYVQNA